MEYVLVKKYSYFLPLTITLPALCISSSSSSSYSGSTASIIECFGLLNDFFSIWVGPIIYFHDIQIIFDIILPPCLGSS
jgi:hypothetical protein